MTHLAVEGPATLFESIRDERASAGREVIVVADESDAISALRLALRGKSLLIHGVATRQILDRLYDDLRRLAPVEVRTRSSADSSVAHLDADEIAVLERLANGQTLRMAAAELHLSARTANRRLASARSKLGVPTTVEAVSVFAQYVQGR